MTRILKDYPIRTAVFVAFLLALPSFIVPFVTDDLIHISILEAVAGDRTDANPFFANARDPLGIVNIFNFYRKGAEENVELIRSGMLPWWSLESLHLSFWRPLSSLSEMLDYKIFGRNPVGFHIQSLLWYMLFVGLVGLLYRRFLPSLLPLALLLFAMDATHCMPVGWIANRNSLIAGSFGLAGLLAHIRWQEEDWKPGLPLSVACFVLALLGGEAALGVFAYLAAYQLLGRRASPAARAAGSEGPSTSRTVAGEPLAVRLIGLLPGLIVGLTWAIAYRAMDFGARGSGLYLDPRQSPLEYLALAPQRMLLLICGQFAKLPSDLTMIFPQILRAQVLVGVVVTLVIVWLLRWAWSDLGLEEQHALRWLLVGSLGAMLPVVATFALDRLLLLPGIALTAVTALILRKGWQSFRNRTTAMGPRRWAPLLVLPFAFAHIVMPPLLWVLISLTYRQMDVEMTRVARVFEYPEDKRDREVLIINASDPFVGLYVPVMCYAQAVDTPRGVRVISMVPSDHLLRRPDEQSLQVEVEKGAMLRTHFERLFRDNKHPFAAGDVVVLNNLRLRVDDVIDGAPTKVSLLFEAPLEQTHFDLMTWRDGDFRMLEIPTVGETVRLPWTPGIIGM